MFPTSYTKTEDSLQVICDRLVQDNGLHKRTKLGMEDIMGLLELLELLLIFSFYRNKFGVPVSSILFNLLMEFLEQEATAPFE